jgi:hypothetical protein
MVQVQRELSNIRRQMEINIRLAHTLAHCAKWSAVIGLTSSRFGDVRGA